ncbi:aldehyde dehydrogenase family protein [Amycolatopsis carbonis]|uniref:Aldehyde dehydrogenase family protein n=1 Tax=Amycolatopsis carbonis TaxID=715471 RepID=A0A9Y2MVQ4_9PSEU|nr:aldehyde dehydrogenase family protein [Amycolatopsis sp. 2-15]WIX76977.1 aldehyde dehydrogenase family protein [Amycolatopsis sp. 2-15]
MPFSKLDAPGLEHVIGDSRMPGTGHVEVTDAPDGCPLYQCPMGTASEVDFAVGCAAEQFSAWRWSTSSERSRMLGRAARFVADAADEIAGQVTLETGKTLAEAHSEVRSAARILETTAGFVPATAGTVTTDHSRKVWGLELTEPAGVVAVIGTWNMPVQVAALKISAALAAGCAVIYKPSPLAAATAGMLVDAFERAGLPVGTCAILHGGAETAQLLASHSGIAVVSVTGSELAGQELMRSAASGAKRCVLELGGKSANIVFADADLDRALQGVVTGFVRNQGAVCTAGSRILIQDEVYPQFLERLALAVEAVRVGDPFTAVDVGAVRSQEHCDALSDSLEKAVAFGAKVCAGGGQVTVPGRSGAYFRPALVAEVDQRDSLWQDELFGPVAVCAPFRDERDAISLANDSRFGLAAGIWARDLTRLERVWRELDVGTVYVNSYHRIDSVPLAASGRKMSGHGAEHGAAGIREFLASKSVHIYR